MIEKRQDQIVAIRKARTHFRKHSRGKMVLPCGLGKTLNAFWIMRALRATTTVFMCPSIALIKQGLDEWRKQASDEGLNVKFLCVCSDNGVGRTEDECDIPLSEVDCPVATDPKIVRKWLKDNQDSIRVVFSTYHSSDKATKAFRKIQVDLAVFDEAHRTAGAKDSNFALLLSDSNMAVSRRLFMTATERICNGDELVSMDDESVYGKLFHSMSFKEAIAKRLLTDYRIVTIHVTKQEIERLFEKETVVRDENYGVAEEIRMLAAMLAVKKASRIFKLKSGISYHTTINRAQRFASLIRLDAGGVKMDAFHVSGKMDYMERNEQMEAFAVSKRAIITNARCLQEGVNIKAVDFVAFVDPIKSQTMVVQASGRSFRKCKGKKMSYIILPILVDENGTLEANQEAYRSTIDTVIALGAIDSRIIVEFTSWGESSSECERVVRHDISEYHGVNLGLRQLSESIRVKISSRMKLLIPPPTKEEIIKWCKEQGITSSIQYTRSTNKPEHFGVTPWLRIGLRVSDIFGKTNFIRKTFIPHSECIAWCIENAVNSKEKYVTAKIPEGFPTKPWEHYKLGVKRFFAPARVRLTFDEVVQWCRQNNVYSEIKLREVRETKAGKWNTVYSQPWKLQEGMNKRKFFDLVRCVDYSKRCGAHKQFMPMEDAIAWCAANEVTSSSQLKLCQSRNKEMPSNLERVYPISSLQFFAKVRVLISRQSNAV